MKKALGIVLGLAVVVAVAFGIYAYHSEIAPVDPGGPSAFDPALVERGRLVASAGFCAECHTLPGAAPYSGNYPLDTGFGVIYGSNITPDPETGIGRWSEAAFHRAMTEGVDRRGRHLFPAFPYDHFTKMTDADIGALYAYLMAAVTPVRNETRPTTIAFPLNLRVLQAGWKMLFVDFGSYQPDPSQSEAWNRGAYLVEGLSHCGACHTPRNALGAERQSAAFEGATIDRWFAPALTAGNASAVPWTTEELNAYLKSGVSRFHGVAAGPMGPVVHAGLRDLPDADIEAIAIYLGDRIGVPEGDEAGKDAVTAALAAGGTDRSYRDETGKRLYATACAACHYNARELLPDRPDLAINSATRVESPDNLIQVILNGVDAPNGIEGVVMPGFRAALDDAQIAAIANYLRSQRAQLAPWTELTGKVGAIRQATAPIRN